MYFITIPRSVLITNEQFCVWDVIKDDEGGIYSFPTLENAKQYVEINGFESKYLTYYIVELVG